MSKSQLDYFIALGLKTSREVSEFRALRALYSEDETIKIITMQRG